MPSKKLPMMARSRGQLATVYAPHSLFTFEGGTGACVACSAPNREYQPVGGLGTKQMIYRQIVEFMESWLARACAGRDTLVPVAPARALDDAALHDGAVRLPMGSLHFQVPDRVDYVPFPTAFVCTSCGLHRECAPESIATVAPRFAEACPRDHCADDWQQLDVVMAHWSGRVEALTPLRRRVDNLRVQEYRRCEHCAGDRFYLRRNGATFARWCFECVECGTLREIRLADRDTLETLAQDLAGGAAVLPQINMEPVSYRASAAFYPHGDRLLVFGNDTWIKLLQTGNETALGRFLAERYSFPTAALEDHEKERLLRDAGLGPKWETHLTLRRLLSQMGGDVTASRALQEKLAEDEAQWNRTVFAARGAAPDSLAKVIAARQQFIQRYDPVRMATEHKTLLEERLRAGATLADGRLMSVDVTRPDEFMLPDNAVDAPRRRTMVDAVTRRLRTLGIAEMRLVRGLQVCEYTFGYTRTSPLPLITREKAGPAQMPVRLNLFGLVRVGEVPLHPVLCLEQSNEAFYVRLDEPVVRAWLERNHVAPPGAPPSLGGRLLEGYTPIVAFSRFLDEYRRERQVDRSAYPLVYTLLHTIAHHFIGVAASMSGLDPGSFGEHLFVPDLAFLVYRRGMTMDLGNLSSMWRDRGDPEIGNEVLDRMVCPESLRCGSESVCTHHGGACPDCFLIPETACLTRNELLSRSVLAGRGTPRWDSDARPLVGFYSVSAEFARDNPERP